MSNTDSTGAFVFGAILVYALLGGCSEKWDGFVYPDKYDLTRHYSIGSHKSLEACRLAARTALYQGRGIDAGDYECGLNCKPIDGGMNLCEKTER